MRPTRFGKSIRAKRGAILPVVAIAFPVILLMSGLVINIAYLQLCQTELQISTDLSAKAAGFTFSKTKDASLALQSANEVGQRNFVGGEPLVFAESDLEVGTSQLDAQGRYAFQPNVGGNSALFLNAIRLTGNRTATSPNGAVAPFLPNITGSSGFDLTRNSVATQVEVEIALVIDRSGSMAYADDELAVYPPIPASAPDGWEFGDFVPEDSRWVDMMFSVDAFLLELANSPLDERISLVTYADSASEDVPLTQQYSQIIDALNNRTAAFEGGGTNIAAGLTAGQNTLASNSREFAANVVIVLTDGKRSVGSNPIWTAQQIAKNGAMVISITFAMEADQYTMKRVASEGNGFHIHARTASDLTNAFKDIGRRLPTLLTN